jgi:hypothetical protein
VAIHSRASLDLDECYALAGYDCLAMALGLGRHAFPVFILGARLHVYHESNIDVGLLSNSEQR